MFWKEVGQGEVQPLEVKNAAIQAIQMSHLKKVFPKSLKVEWDTEPLAFMVTCLSNGLTFCAYSSRSCWLVRCVLAMIVFYASIVTFTVELVKLRSLSELQSLDTS